MSEYKSRETLEASPVHGEGTLGCLGDLSPRVYTSTRVLSKCVHVRKS